MAQTDAAPADPVARAVSIARDADDVSPLRERKKALTRQLIADTATALFAERGYDAVRISDIARACGLSTKTVTNYFATKDALLFAHLEHLVEEMTRGISEAEDRRAVVAAVVDVVGADVERICAERPTGSDSSPARRSQNGADLSRAELMAMARLTDAVESALRDRFDLAPADSEAVMVAHALIGLWCVEMRSLATHGVENRGEALSILVKGEVARAARLLDGGWFVD
jgi:AcrR family transcriptional regulator